MIRIAIVGHQPIFLDSISLLLNIQDTLEVSFTTTKAKELLDQVKSQSFDIIIMDDQVEDMECLKMVTELRKRRKKMKVLILSDGRNPRFVRDSYLTGSSGYITKNETREDLLEAIETVAQGKHFFGRQAIEAMIAEPSATSQTVNCSKGLTKRETQIVDLLVDEKSSIEIASLLHISPGTVETHRHNILKKLNVKSTIGVVKYALRAGLAS